MKYYQEITLLDNADEDASLYFLWSKLYLQLHLALVEVADGKGRVKVGVSFPKYKLDKPWLGDKLRLFGDTEQALESLQLSKWLSRLSDYIHIKRIQPVPNQVTNYAFFSRLNEKGNDERLARRRAKKMNISYEDALLFFRDKETRLQTKVNADLYPFINIKSLSTDGGGNKYPLIIVKTISDTPVFGDGFSTYGLSKNSSVPVF